MGCRVGGKWDSLEILTVPLISLDFAYTHFYDVPYVWLSVWRCLKWASGYEWMLLVLCGYVVCCVNFVTWWDDEEAGMLVGMGYLFFSLCRYSLYWIRVCLWLNKMWDYVRVSANVSFICSFCLLRLHVWNHSVVLSSWSLFSIWSTSDVHNFVFKHPLALIYYSHAILPSTVQLIYFLLLFIFTSFGRMWPSSGVFLAKTVSLCGMSHFYYIRKRYVLM
jgi:hypothetical protein